MRLNAAELERVRRAGAFVRHRCDQCGKALNQSFYYCLKASDDLRWCSRSCQDEAMGWGEQDAAREACEAHSDLPAAGLRHRIQAVPV